MKQNKNVEHKNLTCFKSIHNWFIWTMKRLHYTLIKSGLLKEIIKLNGVNLIHG